MQGEQKNSRENIAQEEEQLQRSCKQSIQSLNVAQVAHIVGCNQITQSGSIAQVTYVAHVVEKQRSWKQSKTSRCDPRFRADIAQSNWGLAELKVKNIHRNENKTIKKEDLIIGPESDHWLCLSVTDSCLVNLIDLILPCEDANSKLVEVVTVVDVDDEDRVGNSLMLTWELKLGNKDKLLFRL